MADDLRERIQQRIRESSSSADLRNRIRDKIGAKKPGEKKKPKGIWGHLTHEVGNVGHVLASAPRGIAGLVGDAATELANDIHKPAISFSEKGDVREIRKGETHKEALAREAPFSIKTAESFGRTAGDIRHPTHFARAYKEGELFPKIIEDIGNAAIVLGPAAKGVTAGGASVAAGAEAGSARAAIGGAVQRVGSHITRAGEAADVVAAAPARVWTVPAGVIFKGASKASRAAGLGERVAASTAGVAVREAVDRVAEARRTRQNLRENYLIPAVQERQLIGREHELIVRKAEKVLGDVDAQYANHLVRTGQSPLVDAALKLEGPERARFVRETWGAEQAPSEGALQMARNYSSGALDAATRDAMDVSWEATNRMGQAHEASALAGEGRVAGPMDPAQIGSEPVPRAVQRELERKGGAARERYLAEGPPEVAPGRYKPALFGGRRGRAVLHDIAADLDNTVAAGAGDHLRSMADEIPQTMADLHAAGIDPEYIIGGVEERAKGAARIPGAREQLPTRGRLSSERMKKEGRLPKSTRAVGRRYVEEASKIIENKTAARIADEVAVTADKVLGERLAGLADDAPERAELQFRLERGGHDLGKEMEREGFVPWDPNSPHSSLPLDQVKGETLFLPTDVHREFQRWFKPGKDNLGLRVYDAATRGWKHSVLALSPGWHLGNMAGNIMLATVGGGLSPAELARYGREALRVLREEERTGQVHFPPRLYGAGMGGEMLNFFANRPEAGGGIFGRHPIQASYRFNSFIDDWGRSAVYLAKRAKGVSEPVAVREALKAMGDFGRMTAVERNVVRRAMPFYAWSRHITQLAFHLPLEHPWRVAWTMHLGSLYKPEGDDWVPGFLEGAVPVGGGRYVSLSRFMPFADAISSPFASPRELLRGLNPIASTAFTGATGFSTKKGRMLTRSPGSGPIDEFGNQTAGFIGVRPFAHLIAQMTPEGRALELLTQPNVARYDSGEALKIRGQTIPQENSRLTGLTQIFGVPIPSKVDVESMAARREQKLEAARKARERYRR